MIYSIAVKTGHGLHSVTSDSGGGFGASAAENQKQDAFYLMNAAKRLLLAVCPEVNVEFLVTKKD